MNNYKTIGDVKTIIKTVARREKLTDLRKLRGVLNDIELFVAAFGLCVIAFKNDKSIRIAGDLELFTEWQKQRQHGDIMRLVAIRHKNSCFEVTFF